MNIWIVREHEYGVLRIYAYTKREKAESHLCKYLAARIRDCGELGDAFQRTEKQCMAELNFDDCDGTWIAVDKLEADHGQYLEMDD